MKKHLFIIYSLAIIALLSYNSPFFSNSTFAYLKDLTKSYPFHPGGIYIPFLQRTFRPVLFGKDNSGIGIGGIITAALTFYGLSSFIQTRLENSAAAGKRVEVENETVKRWGWANYYMYPLLAGLIAARIFQSAPAGTSSVVY